VTVGPAVVEHATSSAVAAPPMTRRVRAGGVASPPLIRGMALDDVIGHSLPRRMVAAMAPIERTCYELVHPISAAMAVAALTDCEPSSRRGSLDTSV